LLWLNMLTDVVPALALALEPAEEGVMERPPRDPEAPLFDARSLRRLARHAPAMTAASLAAYGLRAAARAGPGARRAMAFTSLATSQLLHTSAWRAGGGADTPYLRGAVLGGFALQIAALGSAPMRAALAIGAAPASALGIAALLGVLPTVGRRG